MILRSSGVPATASTHNVQSTDSVAPSANGSNNNANAHSSNDAPAPDMKSSHVQKKIRRLVQDVAIITWKHNYRMYRTAIAQRLLTLRNSNPLMFQQNTNHNTHGGPSTVFCGLTL